MTAIVLSARHRLPLLGAYLRALSWPIATPLAGADARPRFFVLLPVGLLSHLSENVGRIEPHTTASPAHRAFLSYPPALPGAPSGVAEDLRSLRAARLPRVVVVGLPSPPELFSIGYGPEPRGGLTTRPGHAPRSQAVVQAHVHTSSLTRSSLAARRAVGSLRPSTMRCRWALKSSSAAIPRTLRSAHLIAVYSRLQRQSYVRTRA